MYLRNCFVMCGFILKRYTFLVIQQVGDTLFVENPKGHLGALEAYGEKLNIPGQRPERIFRGNCFVMSGFISQHDTFCLSVCLFLRVTRLEMLFLWNLWEDILKPINSCGQNQVIPPIKAMKKRSVKLHCMIGFISQSSFHSRVGNRLSLPRICQGIFGSPWRPMLRNQISPEKQ